MIYPNYNNKLSAYKYFVLFLVVFHCIISCTDNRRKTNISKVLTEWIGKEIQFPDHVQCFFSGRDTVLDLCAESFQKEFKILLYVDSTGCSDCRLKLNQWKQLIAETDSLYPDKVGFLFFFQPKSLKGMEYIFVRDRFDYPVLMDVKGEINDMNRFPTEMQYQCFLLDSNNKVLLIGNPTTNRKIWELYKAQINNGDT